MDIWSEIREFQRRQRAVSARLRRKRKQRRDQLIEAGVPYLPLPSSPTSSSPVPEQKGAVDPALERRALEQLLNPLLEFPVPCKKMSERLGADEGVVWELLQKFSGQELLELQVTDAMVSSVNADKLSALAEGVGALGKEETSLETKPPRNFEEAIEKLLNTPSVREMESRRMGTEIHELLNAKSVMEQLQLEKFQSSGGSQLQEFCSHKTRDSCRRARGTHRACGKLHFRKIIQQHTDENLGDCSFLNTCFHTDTCKFVHYEIDTQREVEPVAISQRQSSKTKPSLTVVILCDGGMTVFSGVFIECCPSLPPPSLSFHLQSSHKMTPPQWVNCDLRSLDMTCLGKFSVVMADPPWDIHMELPYGVSYMPSAVVHQLLYVHMLD